uniref:Ligand dependent nuclear receptor corepressor n=1 Tax=Cyclopterus lumpus TaxID=8103 RepID=A0A8C2XJL4_CYCLU
MQRMIRQFAAEYTSKTTQDDSPPNGAMKDRSHPIISSSAAGGTAAASAQNPVLSKLLLSDQDGPLDLSVKKSEADPDPTQQDGVLDLSTKKNHSTGNLKAFPGFSPEPGVKGAATPETSKLLQDGLRENYVDSNSFKPPLARSLRIKEELLSQKHRLLSQPAALSLASLESAGLLSHVQSYALLGQKGSSSFWGSKAHLESLMKLKQASGALSGALSDLKDLPTFLENHHNHHGAQHHHNEGKRDQGHSPPVDLKIPQVRGMDLSWDSHASELYGYGAMGVGGGGHGENILSRKLRAILPKQNRRGEALEACWMGPADYWSSDLEHSGSGPAYSTPMRKGTRTPSSRGRRGGRYRQYNTDILEEAITVVMSGKMSVSKAQNMLRDPAQHPGVQDDGPPLAAAELKDNVKEEIDDDFKANRLDNLYM